MVAGPPPLRGQEAGDAPADAASGLWLWSGRCPVSGRSGRPVVGGLEFSWRGTPPGAGPAGRGNKLKEALAQVVGCRWAPSGGAEPTGAAFRARHLPPPPRVALGAQASPRPRPGCAYFSSGLRAGTLTCGALARLQQLRLGGGGAEERLGLRVFFSFLRK